MLVPSSTAAGGASAPAPEAEDDDDEVEAVANLLCSHTEDDTRRVVRATGLGQRVRHQISRRPPAAHKAHHLLVCEDVKEAVAGHHSLTTLPP